MPPGAAPCFRCGTFIAPGTLPLEGLALCRGCLTESRREPASWFVAPADVQGRRLVVLCLVTLAVSALLLLADPAFPAKILALRGWPSPELTLPLSCGVLVPLVFLLTLSSIPHGREPWKRQILESLGIDRVDSPAVRLRDRSATDRVDSPSARLRDRSAIDPGHDHLFRVAAYVERPPSLLEAAVPPEIGLATLAEGGVAFLGTRGTRLVLPRERIASATTVRLGLLWPPRTALCVGLGDGSRAHLALLDRPTERANADEAREWAARLSPGRA